MLLTCHFQGCISTHCFPKVVPCDADVASFIGFASAPMHNAQEEQGSARQEHPVGPGIVLVGLHPLTILVPLNGGSGPALGLAVQSGGLALGHNDIRRVLHNPRGEVLLAKTRSYKTRAEGTSISILLAIVSASWRFTRVRLTSAIIQNAHTTILFRSHSFVLYASHKPSQFLCKTDDIAIH